MFSANFNKERWTKVVAFLEEMKPQLSANTQKLISQGKINPRETTLVVRKDVTAGGTINLLDGFSTRETGRNDFDGQKLTNGRNFAWEFLTINYGVAPTGTTVENVDYVEALPPQLKSANFVLKQNQNVIRSLSVAAINEAKHTDQRYYWLGGLALLLEEQTVALELQFANGVSIDAGTGNSAYVEVILGGHETAVKQ